VYLSFQLEDYVKKLVGKIGLGCLVGLVLGILVSCFSTPVYDNYQDNKLQYDNYQNDPIYSRQLIGVWLSEQQGGYTVLSLNENGTGSESFFDTSERLIGTLSYRYKATAQVLVIDNLTQRNIVSLYYNMINDDSLSLTNNNGTPILYQRTGVDPGGDANTTTGVEGALSRAADQALQNIPQNSRIAIVYITAQDSNTVDFIAGELEFIWVNKGYIITDRNQLDKIRQEQNFQMNGEVDDDTVVSIGKIIGADIIVTGRVDGEADLRRLRLRAINIETAQVVGAASERL
jgi:hypothetical protein